jgi:hypothetical protein
MVPVTSYVQWYAEPGRDMYPQGYGELFAPFDAHITIVSPSELLTDVATSEDTNLAFVQLDMEGFVRVFHRIRRIDPIMGGPQDAYSGRTVALVGDVSSMGVIYCGVPPAAFHRTAVVDQVATTTAIGALIQTQPGGQVIITAYRDLGLEYPASPVRSRYWMLIPPRLVSEILRASSQPEGLTPRDLWENVVAPLLEEEDPIRASMAPCIEWCRLAYAGGIGGANPLSSAAPPPLHFGGRLEQSRCRSLAQDLPARFGQAPLPAAAAAPLPGPQAAAVVTLSPEALTPLVQVLQTYNQDYLARMDAAATVEAERRAQEDERRAQEKVKLPSSRWGKTLPTLMKLCNVDDEVFLPAVWQDLASHGSKSDRRTLQFHMDLEYPDLGESGKLGALVSISAALAQDLVNFRFIGHTPDVIGVGLSIFMVSYPTTDAVAALRDSVALYNQQVDGVQAVTVAETDKMREDQKFRYPTTYLGVKQVLWSYHRL